MVGTDVNDFVELARMAHQAVCDAGAWTLMPDHSATRLENIPGTTKRLAWCPPALLDEMNAVGRALNCSINDALPSCVTGAIGICRNTLGDETAGLNIN